MVFTASSDTKIPMTRSMLASFRAFARLESRAAKFRTVLASALALAVIMTAWPMPERARAQEGGLLDKIFGGSERFGSERNAAPPAAAGPPVERGPQASGSDMVVRLDRLESQIRQLTGIIEQLQFRNQQLEAQVRRMQEEGAQRGMPPRAQNLPPQSPPAVTATPGMPGRRGDAFDPGQNPNAPGAPHVLGSVAAAGSPPPMPPAPADPHDGQVGAPGGRGAGSPLDLANMSPPGQRGPNPGPPNAGVVATLPPSATPRDEYDLAYGYVLRKDYALAEDSFRNFLSKYPTDRLAGDATYWFGESLFQRQRYRDAAEAFLNVSTKYESSAKAPDALLRLGQSLAALGEKEAACASLGEVMRKFPRASAVVKQGVEREQKRVRC
jgi:tol-pal system protein YbgF